MCRLDLGVGGGARAIFDTPQWAPTPGQYLVLYDGELCLGGGVIAAPSPVAARESTEVMQAL